MATSEQCPERHCYFQLHCNFIQDSLSNPQPLTPITGHSNIHLVLKYTCLMNDSGNISPTPILSIPRIRFQLDWGFEYHLAQYKCLKKEIFHLPIIHCIAHLQMDWYFGRNLHTNEIMCPRRHVLTLFYLSAGVFQNCQPWNWQNVPRKLHCETN